MSTIQKNHSRFSSRRIQIIATLFFVHVVSSSLLADDNININVEFPRSTQCRVNSTVEHEGHVILLADQESKTKPLPLKVRGKLDYFQRTTSSSQAIRYFQQSLAKIRLEKGNTNPSLSQQSRLIVARSKPNSAGRVEMASIQDMLTQEELELLQTPADPLRLPAMFNKDDLKVGDSWKPNRGNLARFLSVHSIKSSTVSLKLKKIDKNVARIYLGGDVVANMFDVTTNISVHGLAMIDVQNNRIKSLKVSLQENRPPGQIEPGFRGTTRIDSTFNFDQKTPELSNQKLAKLAKSRKIQQRLKYTSDIGAFQIIFEPRWKLIAGESDSAIMRFIDHGQLVTQCNVVLLPARPANQPLALDKFELEIAKKMDANKRAEVITSNQKRTRNGLSALSVVVEGEEEGLPVNWFYYHLSAKDGRQITFVFTLAKSVAVEAKGVADQLINEFRFMNKVAKKSTARATKTTRSKR